LRESRVLKSFRSWNRNQTIITYRSIAGVLFITYLDLALRSRGIGSVIISGGSTEVGVAATIYAARDLDYNLIIVRDACGSGHSDEVHNMFMDNVFPRMGRVRTTSEVLKMIQESRKL
jgi:ureidoacrylate peracid hydrolase